MTSKEIILEPLKTQNKDIRTTAGDRKQKPTFHLSVTT